MEDYKSFLTSKAVWGGIVAVLAGLLPIMGYQISAEDTATLTDYAAQIAAVGGGLVAIYGRVVASKKIG